MTAALLFPPTRRTREPVTKIATASPAAAVMRGFTPPSSALRRVTLHHPFGWAKSEDERAIRPGAQHSDCLVDPDRRPVLRPDEEADRWHLLQQQPAEIPHPALGVALVPRRRVDPHLLHLDGAGGPGGCLCLEEDRAALDPQPRATLLDLRPRTPAEAVRVAGHRIDPDLLLVRGRAGGQQQLEVLLRRRTQAGVPWRRRLGDRVDGLSGAVVARARHVTLQLCPELVDGALLADDHSGPSAGGGLGEAAPAGA